MLEALDGEIKILDPGRKNLAEDASGVGEAEFGVWLHLHCWRALLYLPDVSAHCARIGAAKSPGLAPVPSA
ncbi:hypothetical protein BwSH20_50090 [Bradyrhizobium ottawaense]|nr:hypothetical protein SG09_67990 [Bradyrhizobium ottawaense]GMO25159.1 hypothetical protein BwSF12_20320 [Bradyrhizobium ottawaense]GMO37826.1 hypothetical protein BwSF21_46400 [Bradyrhizobium ottawaense]GMO52518.1 hypothetical protein BwSH14_75050 [Bradyrhizobium ottawaense]GMO63102.1 hypothetical protein BwSG20_20330 [Bradyrhizobium ottawaense]